MLETLDFGFELRCAGFILIDALILLVLHVHLLLDLGLEVLKNRKLALEGEVFLAHLHGQMLVQTLQVAALDLQVVRQLHFCFRLLDHVRLACDLVEQPISFGLEASQLNQCLVQIDCFNQVLLLLQRCVCCGLIHLHFFLIFDCVVSTTTLFFLN